VFAPSKTQARIIASEAEFWRAKIAKDLLNKELPPWTQASEIRYTELENASDEGTKFKFGNPLPPLVDFPDKINFEFVSARIQLAGSFLRVVELSLPHEVARCVLTAHCGKLLPRWAEEGIANMFQPLLPFQIDRDLRIRDEITAGHAYHLKHLFKMTDDPKNARLFADQSHSIVRFLGMRSAKVGHLAGPIPLVWFLSYAQYHNWDSGLKNIFGVQSVDELEAEWIQWLKTPESRMEPKVAPSLPSEEKPDFIPPTRLPSVVRDPAAPNGFGPKP
jgi:hypothetical protein